MKKIAAAVWLCFLPFIVGCHSYYSLSRSASATQLPSVSEVQEVVEQAPDVTEVKLDFVQPPRHFSLYHGIGKDPDYHQILISAGSEFVVLVIGREKGKEIGFYRLWRDRPPSEAEIERTVILIDSVYERLLVNFPSLPATDDFTEARRLPIQSAQPTRGKAPRG
jgi:hypothetical protein